MQATAINYGTVTPSLIGYAMKEMVRRAIKVIRNEQFTFEAKAKLGHSGEMDDLVTSADQAAQDVYVKMIREAFPTYGILAEEDNLRIECRHPGHDLFFTVDPLDGTKAFGRGQSHGVGTMISLVCDGQVIAAYVGDINTQEIFGYRPESDKVHRITGFGEHAKVLEINPDLSLRGQYVMIRERPERHADVLQAMLAEEAKLFKDLVLDGGSIGTSLARLWKGEVGAAMLVPKAQTPWDNTPVVGISQKLGFAFFEVFPPTQGKQLIAIEPMVVTEVQNSHLQQVLIVHESRVQELEEWLAQAGQPRVIRPQMFEKI